MSCILSACQIKTPILPDRVVFLSDVHLGIPGEPPGRAKHLASFLRSLQGTISHLYLVGDIFDFWFEYRHVVPNTAPEVIFELHNLVRSGIIVTLFAGNHDFWHGPYLRDGVGLNLVPDGTIAEHQGKRLYIHHGDGFFPQDNGYRLLKKVLRNRIAILLFGLIHPDLGHRIARITSKSSREYLTPPPEKAAYYTRLFRDIADGHLAEGYDAVVYGHGHVALIEERPAGTMVLLGDWLVQDSYVLLENGTFTLHYWQPEEEQHV